MNVDGVRAICAEAIETEHAQMEEDEIEGIAGEPLDFGGNVDDAVSYGENRGTVAGAASLAREILKFL